MMNNSEPYHMRRNELEIKSESKMFDIIRGQRYLTLAMCRDDRPYLVSLNYGFDPVLRCFYFHCARTGKKIDILSANPFVWGQIIEDLGYVEGECEYNYRSVAFEGKVTFLDEVSDKRRALEMMIEGYERDAEDAEDVKRSIIGTSSLDKVCVGRIQILSMTGKESLPKKK